MTARLFHCTIYNRGTGNITWVDDHLDDGVWENAPSASARLIKPGNSGQWQAESGGDIPIVGNIATGTKGWVLFRTFGSDSVGSPYEVYINVDWDVPYWHISAATANVAAFRFDTRNAIGSGQFDTRDHRPPNISVSAMRYSGSDSVQDVPWLFVEIWPGFSGKVAWDGKALLEVYVDNNVPPDEPVRYPAFGAINQTPKATPVPLHFSTPALWVNEWAGENVEAWITTTQGGLFDVVILEKDARVSPNRSDTNNVGITRAAFVKKSFDATRASRSSQVISDFRLEVQTNVGTATETRRAIAAHDPLYHRAIAASTDLIAMLAADTHRIGGDYLSLNNDATLEMCKLLYQGGTLGYALRYRRPSSVPSLLTLASFDELLYIKTILR